MQQRLQAIRNDMQVGSVLQKAHLQRWQPMEQVQRRGALYLGSASHVPCQPRTCTESDGIKVRKQRVTASEAYGLLPSRAANLEKARKQLEDHEIAVVHPILVTSNDSHPHRDAATPRSIQGSVYSRDRPTDIAFMPIARSVAARNLLLSDIVLTASTSTCPCFSR